MVRQAVRSGITGSQSPIDAVVVRHGQVGQATARSRVGDGARAGERIETRAGMAVGGGAEAGNRDPRRFFQREGINLQTNQDMVGMRVEVLSSRPIRKRGTKKIRPMAGPPVLPASASYGTPGHDVKSSRTSNLRPGQPEGAVPALAYRPRACTVGHELDFGLGALWLFYPSPRARTQPPRRGATSACARRKVAPAALEADRLAVLEAFGDRLWRGERPDAELRTHG